MPVIPHKNLRILRTGAGNNTKAVILSHGGYTPARGCLQRGSGGTTVPAGVTLHFNTHADAVSVGTRAARLVDDDATPQMAETLPSGSTTENYSLKHDSKFDAWEYGPNCKYDVVTVSDDGKAHLKDVWSAITTVGLPWTDVYAFHCRVNKTTYTGSISGPL